MTPHLTHVRALWSHLGLALRGGASNLTVTVTKCTIPSPCSTMSLCPVVYPLSMMCPLSMIFRNFNVAQWGYNKLGRILMGIRGMHEGKGAGQIVFPSKIGPKQISYSTMQAKKVIPFLYRREQTPRSPCPCFSAPGPRC